MLMKDIIQKKIKVHYCNFHLACIYEIDEDVVNVLHTWVYLTLGR